MVCHIGQEAKSEQPKYTIKNGLQDAAEGGSQGWLGWELKLSNDAGFVTINTVGLKVKSTLQEAIHRPTVSNNQIQ